MRYAIIIIINFIPTRFLQTNIATHNTTATHFSPNSIFSQIPKGKYDNWATKGDKNMCRAGIGLPHIL